MIDVGVMRGLPGCSKGGVLHLTAATGKRRAHDAIETMYQRRLSGCIEGSCLTINDHEERRRFPLVCKLDVSLEGSYHRVRSYSSTAVALQYAYADNALRKTKV